MNVPMLMKFFILICFYLLFYFFISCRTKIDEGCQNNDGTMIREAQERFDNILTLMTRFIQMPENQSPNSENAVHMRECMHNMKV